MNFFTENAGSKSRDFLFCFVVFMDLEHFGTWASVKVILPSPLGLSADLTLPSFITEPSAVREAAEQVSAKARSLTLLEGNYRSESYSSPVNHQVTLPFDALFYFLNQNLLQFYVMSIPRLQYVEIM